MSYSDTDFGAYKRDATKGSKRLRNAILRSLGYTPPRKRRAKPVLAQIKPRGRPPHSLNKRADYSADIEQVKRSVCGSYRVGMRSLTGPNRKIRIARPRQVVMYALRKKLSLSYPQIGKLLGGRDHTTIIYGCLVVEGLIAAGDKRTIRALNAVHARLPE